MKSKPENLPVIFNLNFHIIENSFCGSYILHFILIILKKRYCLPNDSFHVKHAAVSHGLYIYNPVRMSLLFSLN